MRIVSTSSLPIDLAAQIAAVFPGARVDVPAVGHVGLPADLADADAVICLLHDRIDTTLFARAPHLRVVANCAVGIDNIDLVAAAAAGCAIANTPDVLTEPTAELAFALGLAVARRLGEGERLVRSGAWSGWALDQLLGVSLTGKVCRIVGMGRIGQAMARRATAFGMQVIYAGPRELDHPGWERRPLDDLFAEADLISLHCPLTSETRHLVDRRRLARCRPTAILVNTARGACVDEEALCDALVAGRLLGAGLDVYEDEPRIRPRLLECPRLVLAPHIGSATTETRTQMAQLCADAVIAVLSGRTPGNLVRSRG